ncbi:MAG: hypothetical protein AAGI34_11155 [Pseudomonadota bacterium]
MPARSKDQTASQTYAEPFSFADPAAMLQGFGMVAMMWAAPWRAAMVVAEEAMREGRRF